MPGIAASHNTEIHVIFKSLMMQESSKFARHAKRRKLTPEDINAALRARNVEVDRCTAMSHITASSPRTASTLA